MITHTYPVTGTFTTIITASNSIGAIMTTSPVTIIQMYRVYLPEIQQNGGSVVDRSEQSPSRVRSNDQPGKTLPDDIALDLADVMATVLSLPTSITEMSPLR
jgi:hypothetical protein